MAKQEENTFPGGPGPGGCPRGTLFIKQSFKCVYTFTPSGYNDKIWPIFEILSRSWNFLLSQCKIIGIF
jgi:hypothetical protein